MANLALSVDEDLLRNARIRALEQGTSVNAVIRDFLAASAGVDAREAAIRQFVDAAAGAIAGSGGRRRSREDLHDRASLR